MTGRGRFPTGDLLDAEANRSVHFAIAVERICGWPVHATYVGEEVVRYQAENSGDQVYDPRGILTAERFNVLVIAPLVKLRRDWPANAFENGQLRIGTRCLGESGIAEDGAVDEVAVDKAIALLRSNPVYLNLVPERPHPRLPAKALSRYSWRACAVYAEALSRVTGLPAATMFADRLMAGHGLTGDQFHAVVMHPDGSVEDVWGRQPAEQVARRYSMLRWRLDQEAHRLMVDEAYQTRPSAAADLAEAEALIAEYRGAGGAQQAAT